MADERNAVMSDPGTDETETPGPIVFERLRAEAFRGFNQPVVVDLNASVVIVHGPNGMGKTSLFDALQWVLLGDLPRLRTARLRLSDEYIVSAYRPGEKATVEVQVRLQGERFTLRRIGDRTGSVLTWEPDEGDALRGQPAEEVLARAFGGGPDLDLPASLNACGLLQQDAARQVLASPPRDRFGTFSQLLGLGELADVEQWAQTRDKEAAGQAKVLADEALDVENRYTRTSARLADLRENAAVRPAVADVAGRLQTAVATAGLQLGRPIDSRDGAVGLAAHATSVAREASELAMQVRRLRTESDRLPGDDDVASKGDALAQMRTAAELQVADSLLVEQRAREALHQLEATQASIGRMAAAVLPHVTGPSCPVCLQKVDEMALRQRLSELEGALSTADAQALAAGRAQALQVAQAELQAVRLREQEHLAHQLRRQQWRHELDGAASRAAALASPEVPLQLPPVPAPLLDAAPFLDIVSTSSTTVAALARELVSAWDSSASNEEARAASDTESTRQLLAAVQERREGVARARIEASTLYKAVQQARLDVVRGEFARLGPLAQDIYSRLDPHPTFQDIDLVSDLFRATGTTVAQVKDVVSGITADPMIVFSSAQANIAAISYVMALNAASAAGAPVLLLDDPMQAMDDINVLGFADLCRHVRQNRQLIVSTHERRFAHLLERKLAPRRPGERTLALEFVGWDRSGPMLKPRDVPDQRDQLRPVFGLEE